MKAPNLRKHATGQWMVKWAGKCRYLGVSEAEARQRYDAEIVAWKAWIAGGSPKLDSGSSRPKKSKPEKVREAIQQAPAPAKRSKSPSLGAVAKQTF